MSSPCVCHVHSLGCVSLSQRSPTSGPLGFEEAEGKRHREGCFPPISRYLLRKGGAWPLWQSALSPEGGAGYAGCGITPQKEHAWVRLCQVEAIGQHGVGPLRAGPQASRVPGCRTGEFTFLKRAHLSLGVTYLRTRPKNQESSFSQQVRHHHTCNVERVQAPGGDVGFWLPGTPTQDGFHELLRIWSVLKRRWHVTGMSSGTFQNPWDPQELGVFARCLATGKWEEIRGAGGVVSAQSSFLTCNLPVLEGSDKCPQREWVGPVLSPPMARSLHRRAPAPSWAGGDPLTCWVTLVMLFRKKERSPLRYQRSPLRGSSLSRGRSRWTCRTDSARKPADASWPPSGPPPSARTRPVSARTALRFTSPRPRPGSRAAPRPSRRCTVCHLPGHFCPVCPFPPSALVLCSLCHTLTGMLLIPGLAPPVARTTSFIHWTARLTVSYEG